MNYCTACHRDFASVAAFDRHRRGDFPQSGPSDFLDRLAAGLEDVLEDWTPKAGRRCLDTDELIDAGLEVDRRGRWSFTRDRERSRYASGDLGV